MVKVQNIAVLTSGGDSPGMNACLRAVVRSAIYHGLKVYGVTDGFNGLISNNMKELFYDDVSFIIEKGGTIIGTARSAEFHEKKYREIAFNNLVSKNIDALIIIGGDGSFLGGSIFSKEFGLPIIGIPASIDNDINGTDYAIGFDTALNTIIESVDRIRDTAASHHRVFLIEVMGNRSGSLALNSAVVCGAEEVFLPEKKEDLMEFKSKIQLALDANKSSIIIVSEGDEIGGAKELYDYLVKEGMSDKLRVSVLGHIQRGGSPTYRDRLYATLFGEKAVVLLLQGKSDLMVGVKDGNVYTCNLHLAQEKKQTSNMDYLKLIRKLSVY